jgi:predicted transposase/invertase (TIGR01784 family)
MIMLEISPQEQARYNEFARRKAENDYEHDTAMSYEIGFKESFQESSLNTTLQIAKNALKMRLEIQDVEKITGLTEQQINELKNEKM